MNVIHNVREPGFPCMKCGEAKSCRHSEVEAPPVIEKDRREPEHRGKYRGNLN